MVNARSRQEPAGREARPGSAPSPRLLARLRARDRGAIPELLTTCGRPMVSAAYVLLQDRDAATRAATLAIGRVWRLPPAAWPASSANPCTHLVAAAAREALTLRETVREVDAIPQPGAAALLALRPEARAAVALVRLAELAPSAAIDALGLRGRARQRALALLHPASDRSDHLCSIVAANVAGLADSLTPGAVLDGIDGPLPAPRAAWRRAVPIAAAVAGVAVLAALLLTAPRGSSPTAQLTPSETPRADGAPAPVGADPPLPAVAELASAPSLADCGIQPADAELAFAGWTTLTQLGGSAPMLESSQPVYAQVPRDPVVWDPRGDAPPGSIPQGRLACLTDAARRLHVVVPLPDAWRAPEVVDGCPASPMGELAGMREIGGPNGFVVLPGPGTSWWANDPSVRILARVAPAPRRQQAVSAWAQPLGPGVPSELPLEEPRLPGTDRGGSTYYLWLTNVRFTSAGCWVIGLAVDGEVVGSAIIPVSERIAATR
jgi:hypothetical protein